MNQTLIIVLGRLCSGKGTFCEPYINEGYHHITTSDVVKHISGKTTRSGLGTTKDLDQEIAQELISRINKQSQAIVDGIRQVSILKAVETALPHVQLIWLEADAPTRKQRFEGRKDRKDDITFELAEQGDDKLGLAEVELQYKSLCKIVNT